MSEPSSGVPGEIADDQVETQQPPDYTPERVELDVDQDKLDAWDDVKSDYQVDPDAGSSAAGQASDNSAPADEGEEGEEGEGTEEKKAGEEDNAAEEDEDQREVKDAGETGEDQREEEEDAGEEGAG